MSATLQNAFLRIRTPMIEFRRFRGKINIQKPRAPHYERARVLAVTRPIYPEAPKNSVCNAIKEKTIKEENPYEKIIAREVYNWLETSKTVVFFHLNSISSEDLFKVRVPLHKQNLHLKSYGRSIMRYAVSETKYETILPLFNCRNCIVFSPDQKLTQLLRIVRKVPQLILLGGIIENRLMSKNEIIAYTQLPDLTTARAQLVSVLNSPAGTMVGTMEAHQNNLTRLLDVHAKQSGNSE